MDHSISASASHRTPWTTEDIRNKIETSRVVVFAKGTPENPRCGFSERILTALKSSGKSYELIDVSEDRSIVAALTAFAGRQYVPLVYANGTLISSSENIEQQITSGELFEKIDAAFENR